jgi:hypothetical protein
MEIRIGLGRRLGIHAADPCGDTYYWPPDASERGLVGLHIMHRFLR